MGNLIVGQSGGPTAVINASLYGVIMQAFEETSIEHVYGMPNGIEGFLKGRYVDMSALSTEELQLLRTTPGAFLGSCRYKLPENPEDRVYTQIFDAFHKLDIEYFLYIGGNDSMDTVSKLSRYAKNICSPVKIAGIPKTIDNDLVLTDHTPGFGSAAKYVASIVREISRDSSVYDTDSVTIIEIMGRHAGWLTGAAALARQFRDDNPVLIYLPESSFNEDTFLNSIREKLAHRRNLIVCVSEGIHDSSGNFVCEHQDRMQTDNFGHKILTGCGKYLEQLVRSKLGVKVRSVELNVTQRCAASYLSETDVIEAEAAGRFGVTQTVKGQTGFMCSFVRGSHEPYEISLRAVDVNEVCNLEKKVPREWICGDGCDVTDDLTDYIRPLIHGEPVLPKKDGLTCYCSLDKDSILHYD